MQRTYHLQSEPHTRVDDQLAARLASEAARRRFDDGSWIHQHGDPSDGFWLILSGQVVIGRYSANGEFTAFAVLGPGNLLGELAHFAGLPRQVDAIADGEVELAWISGPRVADIIAEQPGFAILLLGSLAGRLRTALDRIEEDARLSLTARCARRLATLAEHGGSPLRMTQQDLADLLGTSRVSVGKALSDLAASGLVERGYGWIGVSDPGTLRARFGDSLEI